MSALNFSPISSASLKPDGSMRCTLPAAAVGIGRITASTGSSSRMPSRRRGSSGSSRTRRMDADPAGALPPADSTTSANSSSSSGSTSPSHTKLFLNAPGTHLTYLASRSYVLEGANSEPTRDGLRTGGPIRPSVYRAAGFRPPQASSSKSWIPPEHDELGGPAPLDCRFAPFVPLIGGPGEVDARPAGPGPRSRPGPLVPGPRGRRLRGALGVPATRPPRRPGTEYGGADPDQGRPLLDGHLQVSGHAHRQVWHALPKTPGQLGGVPEGGPGRLRVGRGGRHGHEAGQFQAFHRPAGGDELLQLGRSDTVGGRPLVQLDLDQGPGHRPPCVGPAPERAGSRHRGERVDQGSGGDHRPGLVPL